MDSKQSSDAAQTGPGFMPPKSPTPESAAPITPNGPSGQPQSEKRGPQG